VGSQPVESLGWARNLLSLSRAFGMGSKPVESLEGVPRTGVGAGQVLEVAAVRPPNLTRG
jgi:hypothetical protein